MRLSPILTLALALALAAAPARAFDRPGVPATRTSEPLHIDGLPNEKAWSTAPPIGEFLLMAPRESQAPDESTVVRVLYDDKRIVFGIWCQARRPLRASLTPRDQITDGDHIAIHLDTEGDGQRAYIFAVNPWGVELDGILTQDPDFKWDAVWDAASRRGADAWTAEISVPFRAMRFPARAVRPWRLWIRREVTAWNEVSVWPLYRFSEAGRVMLQAADLTGLESMHSGRSLWVEPYVFGSLAGTRESALPTGMTPWTDERTRKAGADVQTALTSALTLNATWNPDFSQIEADALQIDLNQRFPLQYDEKRPFFLEGAENFSTPLEMIYPRRMADPDAGIKLTGRIGAANTGVLAVRDRGGASLAGSGAGFDGLSWRGDFGIARVQFPFASGSNVGVLVAGHEQRASAEGIPGRADSSSSNGILALDSQLRLSDRWTFEGQLARSSAREERTFAPAGQADSAYSDWIGVARLNYRDRARDIRFGWRTVGPDYRNELGFEERVGVTYRRVNFGWDLFPEKGVAQRVTPRLDALVLHDRTGRPEYADINPNVEFLFRKSRFLIAGFHTYEEHWLNRNYAQQRVHVYYEDLEWRPLTWTIEAQIGDGIYYGPTDPESFLAWTETYEATATLRPSPRVAAAIDFQRLRVARGVAYGEVINLWLLGVNTNVQFTKRLYARLYPQYDSDAEHLDLNGLVGYLLHPGTVVYAGVNGGFDRIEARQRPTRRQFFAKASYRFSL